MRRIIFIIIFFLSIVTLLQAQTLQNVVVMEYKGAKGKTPLANVEVVVGNAGSVVTDKNGACTLNFRTLKPGDHVTIRRIHKEGYEVFNQAILDQWVISRNNEPFVIDLVQSKYMRSLEHSYRRPTERAAATIFENQSKIIKTQYDKNAISKEEYEKRLEKLHNEYMEKLDDIDNYISRFSHIDLSSLNRSEKKIVELLKEGDINGAIDEYDKMDLVGQYTKNAAHFTKINNSLFKLKEAKSKVSEATNHLSQSVMTQITLLQFAGGESNSNRAYELFYDFAKVDTTNYDIILWAAENLGKAARMAQAEELLQYLLNSKDSIKICEGKMQLGVIQTARSNIYEAYKLQYEALKYFCDQAEAKNDSLYLLSQRAIAFRNFVKTASLKPKYKLNDEFINESNNVVKSNYQLNPTAANKRSYVEYLCHIGDIYRKNNKLENVEECLNEALKLQTELYEQDSRRQVAMLAYVHARLATLYIGKFHAPRDWDKANENYKKCVEYYEIAYKINPVAFGRNYASGLAQVSMFSVLTERGYEHAIENYEKALQIYNKTVEMDPTSASSFPASIYPYLGHAYTLNGDPVKGLAFIKEHLADNLEWSKKKNDDSHLFRAYIFICKACLTPQINDLEQAREYYNEAKKLYPSSYYVIDLSSRLGF